MRRAEALGGPADGALVERAAAILLLTRDGARPRPGEEGFVYQLSGQSYVYAGREQGCCSGCGGFVNIETGAETCPLCGGAVERGPVRQRG